MAGEYEISYGRADASIRVQVYRDGAKQETTWVLLTKVGAGDADEYTYRGDKVTWTPVAGDEINYYDDTDGAGIPIGSKTYQPAVDLSSISIPVALITPALYQGDYLQNEEVAFHWNTNEDPSVDGTVTVYKDGLNDPVSAINSGITDTRHFDAGDIGADNNVNLVKIALSDNTWYEPKANYTVMLLGATINGETVDAVLATFSIENRNQGKQFRRDG